MSERIGIVLTLVLLFAVVSQTPAAMRFEQNLGLNWLFYLRGPQPVPEGAAVVAIDEGSVAWLHRNSARLATVAPGLAECLTPHAADQVARMRNATEVPRGLIACLIDRLNAKGARLIIFDVYFALSLAEDEHLASAIRRAGNVLLFERIGRQAMPGAPRDTMLVRRRPTPMLLEAASGLVAFQVELLPGSVTTAYMTRMEDFPSVRIMPVEAARRTGTDVSGLPRRELFSFYGPSWSVPTWTLRQFFDPASIRPPDVRDAVVFVGSSSRQIEASMDGFPVPGFSDKARGLSGVELAATAYLNLRHDQRLLGVGRIGQAMVAALIMAVAGTAALCLGGWLATAAILGVGALAAALTLLMFNHGIWIPAVLPIVFGLPLMWLIVLARKLRFARRAALALLPRSMSMEFLEGRLTDPKKQSASAMFVDIAGSTGMAERHGADLYARVLAHYYEIIDAAVDGNGGAVYEYKGDGILALFSEAETGPAHAEAACRAALSIGHAVTTDSSDLPPLTLRIGIATGPIVMGMLQFGEHGSVSALGDPVNCAARLQEMARTGIAGAAPPAVAVLIDDDTALGVPKGEGRLLYLTTTVLRGRSAPTEVFRLLPAEGTI